MLFICAIVFIALCRSSNAVLYHTKTEGSCGTKLTAKECENIIKNPGPFDKSISNWKGKKNYGEGPNGCYRVPPSRGSSYDQYYIVDTPVSGKVCSKQQICLCKGLSTGAIVGISVGVVVVLLSAIIVLLICRKRVVMCCIKSACCRSCCMSCGCVPGGDAAKVAYKAAATIAG